jgi:hypothetical protein
MKEKGRKLKDSVTEREKRKETERKQRRERNKQLGTTYIGKG